MTRTLAALLLLLTLVACSGAASTAAPSSPAGPTPSPTTISSVEEAAARVVEQYPSLSGIGPADQNLIGGCCSWRGAATADGFEVTFEVGWGDCPAGCIDRHAWLFSVSSDGAVTLLDEQGSPVPSGMPGSDIVVGGGTGVGGGIAPGGTGIQGRALAGPTCPVSKLNDRSCEDRPLAGVTIVVVTATGVEAGRTTTDVSGNYAFSLPPGPYTVEAGPVEGMMRGAEPVAVVVRDGIVTVDLPFDTGIR